LIKRSTYAGVADTGPVPDETFEQKVARLKAVSAAAKQRAEEGGGEPVTSVPTAAIPAAAESGPGPGGLSEGIAQATEVAAAPAAPAPQPASHKPTGQADRTMMRRSTYCGVVDSGPVPGETFAQKVERLRAVAAAAKQRAEEGG
jgi:hypothetical protein